MSHPLSELWPLVGLRVSSGDLELRHPADADLAALAELAREGIHDPRVMPFSTPFTDAPPDERARGTVQWHWRSRGEWAPASWHLNLVTVVAGAVVGTQGLNAKDFAVTREVETGSWLGRSHQGRGIGTRMRQAILHLAFAGLGARTARSGAFEDNPASLRVSEKVGYQADGSQVMARRGEAAVMRRLLLTGARWRQAAPEWPHITIDGLEPCLELFGGR